MKTRNLNSLLVEILFAMLFFALSATVILQVFVAARTESDRASHMTSVLVAAQNLANETYLDTAAVSQSIPFDDHVTLLVEVEEEAAAAGVLRKASVKAVKDDGKLMVEIPCTRYVPDGEVAK